VAESGQVDMASTGPAVSAYTRVLRVATEEGRKLGVEVRTSDRWDLMAESRRRRLNATEVEAASWLNQHSDDAVVKKARRIYGEELPSRVLHANCASKTYGPDWPSDSLRRLMQMREHGLAVAKERRARRAEELLLPTYKLVVTTWIMDEGDEPARGDRFESYGKAREDGFRELRVVKVSRRRKNYTEYEYTLECKPA